MLGQLHLCTWYKIFVINHQKPNFTLNFSRNWRVNPCITHISFHLKHQDQHFTVLLQSCAAKRIRALWSYMSRTLLPKHHPANQWVYWTFLSISPRWFWLWIHPCKHIPKPLWRFLFQACRGCQEPSALNETLLCKMEPNQHRAKSWPSRVTAPRE